MASPVLVSRRLATGFAVAAASVVGVALLAGAAFMLVAGVGPLWIRIALILAGAATAGGMAIPLRRDKLRAYMESESAEDGDNDG